VEIEEIIGQARDAVGVRRIFGEPYKRDGVTIIPAAAIRGGSGGGGGGGEGTAGTVRSEAVESTSQGEDADSAGASGSGAAESEGAGQGRVGSGGGAGFGLVGRPVGAFVIKDGEASWRPVIDVTGIIQRTMLLGGAIYLGARALDALLD
jgi:uncharacterized spore protein YtfJ